MGLTASDWSSGIAAVIRFALMRPARAVLMVLALSAIVCSNPIHAAAQTDVRAEYAQVLADPDNLAVNLRFLDAQIDGGDLAGAAVTLQRILLINPEFDRARLVRVGVFLRLGDDAAALSDLELLAARPLSHADRAEANRLAALVRQNAGDARLSGVIRAGVLGDSNADQAPGAGLLPIGAFNFPAHSRFGGFGELQGVGELPLGGGDGHSLRLEAHGFARAYVDGGNGQSFARLAVGPRLDLGFAFLDLTAVGELGFSGTDLSSRQLGGRGVLTLDLADNLSAGLRVEMVQQWVEITAAAGGGNADGLLLSLRPSLTYRFDNAWQMTGHLSYAHKDAGSPWFSHDAFGGGLGLSYRNARGVAASLSGSLEAIDYAAANPGFTGTPARDDLRLSVGGALAMPVSLLLADLGADEGQNDWASDWSAELFARYVSYRSNVAVYESSNLTLGFSFARRFSL